MRYNSTVQTIRNANRIRGSMLRIGQVLSVPLRGPCTRCPIPPPVVVPPRRLPVDAMMQATAENKSQVRPAVAIPVNAVEAVQAKAEVAVPAEAPVPAQAELAPTPKPEALAEPGLKAETAPEVKTASEEKQLPAATASDTPGT
jgi:hypothetical protein